MKNLSLVFVSFFCFVMFFGWATTPVTANASDWRTLFEDPKPGTFIANEAHGTGTRTFSEDGALVDLYDVNYPKRLTERSSKLIGHCYIIEGNGVDTPELIFTYKDGTKTGVIAKEINDNTTYVAGFFDPEKGEPESFFHSSGKGLESVLYQSLKDDFQSPGGELWGKSRFLREGNLYGFLQEEVYAKNPYQQSAPPPPPTSVIGVANIQYASPWAWTELDRAATMGLVTGRFSDPNFKGWILPVTRAEYCATAVLVYETANGTINDAKKFADTDNEDVGKMASLGIVNGFGNGEFAPNQAITRQEAAVINLRLFAAMTGGNSMMPTLVTPTPNFDDEVAPWATEAVRAVAGADLMKGLGDGTFGAESPYSVEACIITLYRLAILASQC